MTHQKINRDASSRCYRPQKRLRLCTFSKKSYRIIPIQLINRNCGVTSNQILKLKFCANNREELGKCLWKQLQTGNEC